MPKRNRTEADKEAVRKGKRAARHAEYAAQASEPRERRPCPTCVKNNHPEQNTHSRASSRLCPFRKKNKDKLAKEAFGGGHELFTIKTRCERVCQVPGLQQEISAAVERIRDITYEGALLANRHFLRCKAVVGGDCFSQSFFLICMKLVAGETTKCPPNLTNETYAALCQTHAEYTQLRPNHLPTPDPGPLWHALSASAISAEKDARNHIVANFAKKVEMYIFHLLHAAVKSNTLNVANKDLKRLATFVYEKRAGATRSWPPSVEKVDGLEAVVDGVANGIHLGPTPVTEAALFARPHEYLPFFYNVLEFLEATTHSAREPVPKTNPPLTWVKRKMATKVPDWKDMSKTGQRRLVAAVRRCILHPTLDPRAESVIGSRDYILNLIAKTRLKIQEQRFCPKMAIIPRHVRLCTLYPLYSIQRRYIEIDSQTLRSLIKRANGAAGQNLFWDAFNFPEIGVASEEAMQSPRRRFWSVIRSDGVAIDFLFARPKRVKAVPEVTMADVGLDLTRDRLWGVDPGVTDAFVAVDGSNDMTHEVRKTSTREFYHLAGWNRGTRQGQKWKKASPGIQVIENGMPSPKTINTAHFDAYISYVLTHFQALVQFYDDRWRELQFQRYRGRQKALAETCRRFTSGSQKYGVRSLHPEHPHSDPPHLDPWPPPRPSKWKRAAPHDEAKRTVVAFGDGMFSPTMKGKRAGVSRVVFRALRHRERLGHLTLVRVPEFRTSKVCSKCHTLTLEHVRIDDTPLHAVLSCKNCATVWNRDVNAARNLWFVASHMAANNNKPPNIFVQPNTATSPIVSYGFSFFQIMVFTYKY